MNDVYRLLVEEPTYEVKYLIEEQNRNTPSNMFIHGPFLMADEANKNKRIYPLDEMVKEVSRYRTEIISHNRAFGELNHPQSPEINLERVCHLVTDLKQNGNIFEGKSKILHGDGMPLGNLVRGFILHGAKLGVSSRSLGRLVSEKNGISKVADFKIMAVDVVADPSVPTAFVNGILEAKQWILESNGEFAPVYDGFEKKIAKLPSKDKTNYLKEQLISFINALKTL